MKNNKKEIVAYKGFDRNFQCRGMQYAENETFSASDGELEVCSHGLHACINPFDVLKYYADPLGKYAKVDVEGEFIEADSKIACRTLKVNSNIGFSGIMAEGSALIAEECRASKKSRTFAEGVHAVTNGTGAHAVTNGTGAHAVTNGTGAHAVTNGDWAHAVTNGYRSHAVTNGTGAHAVTNGDWAHAVTNGCRAHAVTNGYRAHAVTNGNCAHAVTNGDWAHAVTNGYRSHVVTNGTGAHASTFGRNSIASSLGYKAAASASLGEWIVLAEWEFCDEGVWNIRSVKTVRVDGKKIKADTLYTLKRGKFVVYKD